MGTRNLIRKQQQAPVHRLRTGLLLDAGISGGINDETYNGSGSYADGNEQAQAQLQPQPVYLKHRLGSKHHQIQYVNPDGSILMLDTNEQRILRNDVAHPQHHIAYMQSREVLVGGIKSSSRSASAGSHLHHSPSVAQNRSHSCQQQQAKETYEVLPGKRQPSYQQHQPPIQDQFQHIYGDSERKQRAGIQQNNQASDRQQLILKRHKQQQFDDRYHQRNMSSGQNVQPTEFIEREQQFRTAMLKNQHQMLNNSTGSSTNQHHSLQHQQCQQEQQYDSLDPPPSSTSKHHQNSESFYETSGLRQQPIGTIPEECDDDDELLISEPTNLSLAKRAAIDRKNQLEDLHYATVTAAALLSATANAAAAFAATEKQFKLAAKESRDSSIGGEHHSNQMSSIYSDTYQDVRRNHKQPAIEQQQPQHQVSAAPRYKQAASIQPNANVRAPIYAVAMDPVNFMNLGEHRIQPASMAAPTAVYGHAARLNPNQIYHMLPAANFHQQYRLQQQQQQQQQQQHQQQQQQQQHYQRMNLNGRIQQPPPPHLPLRRQQQLQAALPSGQQRTSLGAHQQLSQVPMGAPPAQVLAMLHRGNGGKGVSLRADMIGRLLMNNLMASQRFLGTEDAHQGLAGGQAQSRALANRLMESHGLMSRELMYGVAGRDKLFGLSNRNNFHIQPPVASSDSSGNSNVPLVLDRNLKPHGFIERICRIDLTIFWWSLLIISFLFIGAIFALSRYAL